MKLTALQKLIVVLLLLLTGPHFAQSFFNSSSVALAQERSITQALKLTATGEVLNLLNRNNLRYAGFDAFDSSTGRVFGQLDRVLPILPSAGVVIVF